MGVITLPKQARPFWLRNDFSRLRKNITYVRRGSSTGEADPDEIQEMGAADRRREVPSVALTLLSTAGNEELPASSDLRLFRTSDPLPDFELELSPQQWTFRMNSTLERDNPDFWREFAAYLQTRFGAINIRFALLNRSPVQLSNVKLEVVAEPMEGKPVVLMEGDDLPELPSRQKKLPSLHARSRAHKQLRLAGRPDGLRCEVRFASLLPGEQKHADDFLSIMPPSAGQLRLRMRILAAELPEPIGIDRVIEVIGQEHILDKAVLERAYHALVGSRATGWPEDERLR